jgi:RNA polymerase sigma-70 factor (ECF subfamily)
MNPEADRGGEHAPLELDPVARSYAEHAAELRRFATSRLRTTVAAEDVVQESFLRLAVEARAGRFPRQPRPWLYRVALNLIISGARRGQTDGAVMALQLLDATGPVDLETPESRCLSLERHRSLGVAMASVEPRARTGLLMAAEGYSGREIAIVIGRTETATRALMCRARARVRRSLTLAEAV